MRSLALCCAVLAGCAGMQDKVDASRQDRCARADWRLVGERDGVQTGASAADRYEYICGDMFQAAPYQEGLRQGLARRPRPPV